MAKEANRRKYLKSSPETDIAVVARNLPKGNAEAYNAVKIPEAEKIVITIITDNYCDALRADYKIAQRYFSKPADPIYRMALHSEHGLACHIEAVVDGRPHSLLFDYGVDFQGVSRNMELLNIDFKALEALGLSHGHFDHSGALVALLKSQKEKFPKGICLYTGEGVFSERFLKLPNGLYNINVLKKEDIEALGFVKVIEIRDPSPIVSGAYLTGKIERVTEYEKGAPNLLVKKGGRLETDDFTGEQSLVLNARGKGLVVLSGCAHAGIVNTLKHAQKITGIEKIHAVIGGFHLTGAKPEVIQRTLADIKAINPDYIVPLHCTGHEAMTVFENEMPSQFILNTAGTRYLLPA